MKTAKLEGRDHWVCPVCMIVGNTVLDGSRGPVFYPADAIKESARAWNAKPVVVYHPEQYGHGFADSPEVFNRQKIGTIFNTRYENGKLKAEAWIDVARTHAVDMRIVNSIVHGIPVEVSTGLVVLHNNELTPGGALIAATLLPDHLAVLPDKKGACSIRDGAGLLVNALYDVLPLPAMVF